MSVHDFIPVHAFDPHAEQHAEHDEPKQKIKAIFFVVVVVVVGYYHGPIATQQFL